MSTRIAATLAGKPVYTVPAKSVMNEHSGFKHKLLCDGPTFTAGSACGYSCTFCYVAAIMRKSSHFDGIDLPHHQVVVRRAGAIEALRKQLTYASGEPKFGDADDHRVIYGSPLVDIAAKVELADESIAMCRVILEFTHWQIRLLSKSPLIRRIAEALAGFKERVIYGLSTGTLDDGLARSFELGTPLVSKRLAALHWLQDHGYRTFGMICPSLPQRDYATFAERMHAAIRAERCEHVWAEPMNVRSESLTRTVTALRAGGFDGEADDLEHVSGDSASWEDYARATFTAHAALYRAGQLRFLQYVTKASRPWWERQRDRGAVLLGKAAEGDAQNDARRDDREAGRPDLRTDAQGSFPHGKGAR